MANYYVARYGTEEDEIRIINGPYQTQDAAWKAMREELLGKAVDLLGCNSEEAEHMETMALTHPENDHNPVVGFKNNSYKLYYGNDGEYVYFQIIDSIYGLNGMKTNIEPVTWNEVSDVFSCMDEFGEYHLPTKAVCIQIARQINEMNAKNRDANIGQYLHEYFKARPHALIPLETD